MADLVGLYNGLRFKKGTREATYYDLTVDGMLTHLDQHTKTLTLESLDRQLHDDIMPRKDYNLAFNRPSTFQVLGIKQEPDAIIEGRTEMDLNAGKQGAYGYARNQAKGLAYDAAHPIDLPNIMPIASNFFVDAVSTLGNLK
jgi:hypothetical protein